MIIAIDGYEANVANRVGSGRYAYELLTHIYQEIKGQRLKGKVDERFCIYVPSKPVSDMPPETDWWQYRIIPIKKLWTWIGLPLGLTLDAPTANVVFSPTHYIPRFVSLPKVMAVMDLSYLAYPELFLQKDLYQLTNWTAYSIRRAAHIFTISQFSKDAIIQTYRVPKQSITVTYPGFTPVNTQSTDQKRIGEKYHISRPYILSVGTLQPRKNFARLIEAFAQYLTKEKTDIDLIIVGKKGWLWEDIVNAPKQFGVEKNVQFLDFVPDSDLPALYSGAYCFVLPSLYEGFGLPVLEAMAYRCPVVVSNISSIPEIAGDAGIYVDPTDVESIGNGIQKAINERMLKAGKERITIGKKRVSLFSWEKAAEQTLEVLEAVAKGNI